MRPIDIHECHRLLLDMAAILDRVCRENAIPYYMLGGTMLGAVRHGGFIPWDDDMDFGIPRDHFDRLRKLLDDALRGTPYRLNTYHNSPNKINYLKMVDTRTCIRGAWETTDTGVNIDLFPLDRGPRVELLTRPFAAYIHLLLFVKDYKQLDASPRRGLKRLIADTLKRLPFRTDTLIAHIDRCILRHSRSGVSRCINYFGHWRAREIFSADVFGEPVDYAFEDMTLSGVTHPDAYLAQLYGDYMQLPPPEKRLAHTDTIFWASTDGPCGGCEVGQIQDG